VRPASAIALLAALATVALVTAHVVVAGAITCLLLCVCLRAPRSRARLYIAGTLLSALAVFVLTPFIETIGSHPLLTGPIVPVLGQIDITSEELWSAGLNALRLAAVGLAFAAYALLVDHDRLLQSVRFARPAALATRLLPTLVESLRARGVEVTGMRGRAELLSPLLASSLERGLNLAEAMEARGYGRPGRSGLPAPPWRARDVAAVALAVAVVAAGALWL
jgi:energy-coupling factor transport system permease protein